MAKTRLGMFNPQFKAVGVAREGEGQVVWGAQTVSSDLKCFTS